MFKIRYLGLKAGTMTLRTEPVEGGLHITQEVQSQGLVHALYPVRDEIHSWVELPAFRTLLFLQNLREKGKHKLEYAQLDWSNHRAEYKHRTYPLPGEEGVDSLASLYFIRAHVEKAPVDFVLFDRKKPYVLRIPKPEETTLYWQGKTRKVWKIQPQLIRGKMKERGSLLMLLTTDTAHIPIKLYFSLPFGKVRATLQNVEFPP